MRSPAVLASLTNALNRPISLLIGHVAYSLARITIKHVVIDVEQLSVGLRTEVPGRFLIAVNLRG